MGELIFIAVIGIICAVVGTMIQRRADRKRKLYKRISQIPFWDIDK